MVHLARSHRGSARWPDVSWTLPAPGSHRLPARPLAHERQPATRAPPPARRHGHHKALPQLLREALERLQRWGMFPQLHPGNLRLRHPELLC